MRQTDHFLKTASIMILLWLLTACHENAILLEPNVYYAPQERFIQSLPEEFGQLNTDELRTEWGKEMRIGNTFAKELDLYRAITSFKRALVLIPSNEKERRLQIEYSLIFCYYLGNHYKDVVEIFESSALLYVPDTFPGFRNLMLILYDSYTQIGECERANTILELIENYEEATAQNLRLSTAITQGELPYIQALSEDSNQSEVKEFLSCYHMGSKSVRGAQTLNALLPGAGYYYVGQKKSALTSLMLNALFTAAAVHFFDEGNIAAGIITLSFEAGWYIGGINGAGLAAKAYNESLYNESARNVMMKQRLFPVLMLQHSF
ncbi:MAG: hypothetical protein Tsb0021_14380 [Chlamydiales bacterium]